MAKTPKDSPAKNKVGRPLKERPSGPGTRLGNFLIDELDGLGLTNEFVAGKLGYARPNIVSAWKTARTKFPLENIFALAELLEINPQYMMALYVEQYMKTDSTVDRWGEIVKMFSQCVTDEEWEVIATIRKARKNNIKPMTPSQKKGLAELFADPDAAQGQYEPDPIIVPEPATERASARRMSRRGHMRDFSVDELEERIARGESTVPSDSITAKKIRKRSAAAITPDADKV